jgi:hypothetical protein
MFGRRMVRTWKLRIEEIRAWLGVTRAGRMSIDGAHRSLYIEITQ